MKQELIDKGASIFVNIECIDACFH